MLFITSALSDCSECSSSPEDESVLNPHSFDDLCVPLYAEMLNFARRMSGNADRAGDVVQEAFKKALRAWPRWRPETGNADIDARAWMYRIVSNTYIKDYHRARGIRRRVEECRDEIMLGTYGREHEDDLRDHVDSPFGDEVEAALGALTDDHRQVIEAFYIREMGCSAIAAELGVPKGTIYSRLARACAALESALGEFAAEEYGFRRRVPRTARSAQSGRRVDLAQPTKRVRAKSGGVNSIVAGGDGEDLEFRQASPK